MTRPGRLATMGWNPRVARELRGDEVEVEVYAIGLNFKVGITPAYPTCISPSNITTLHPYSYRTS